MCNMHYQRWKKYGDPLVDAPPSRRCRWCGAPGGAVCQLHKLREQKGWPPERMNEPHRSEVPCLVCRQAADLRAVDLALLACEESRRSIADQYGFREGAMHKHAHHCLGIAPGPGRVVGGDRGDPSRRVVVAAARLAAVRRYVGA